MLADHADHLDGLSPLGRTMTADEPFGALLARMLPPEVAFSGGPVFDPGESGHAEERAAIATAVAKRRTEFRCGRHHARNALGRLGVVDASIGRRADRTPIWPKGMLGSISHSDRSVVAIAASTADFSALGVDVESAAPLGDDILATVCSPLEIDAMKAFGMSEGEEGKLLFSIKEAVFKALFPLGRDAGGLVLDFHDIVVALDRPAGAFSAELTRVDHRSTFGRHPMRGRYGVADGEVVATLCLGPDDLDAR